ncbi:MAG: GNAT family N-acetyltransferase [Clostridia bacterium]|nr:GNAT family N-acetyltransferase [Clostridia bacterium]
MELIEITKQNADALAPLVAAFRVQLKSYKGIHAEPKLEDAKAEILEFLDAHFPIFAASEDGVLQGYVVCRIDGSCLWVEHLYVKESIRRNGVGSRLFSKAEEIGASLGEETVYNFVHPNNTGMIAFLRSKGYTVLNMLEIRKPYEGEKLTTQIAVEKELFDY